MTRAQTRALAAVFMPPVQIEIYFGQCANRQGITSGFRFSNVAIPQGTQIAQAYLEFTVDGPYSDELSLVFYGEASGNALPFSSARRPDQRPLTQTSAAWHIPVSDRWELGQIRTSPELTAIVQEIVNRPDWASGNALAIIVKNSGPASGPNLCRRVIGYERPVWFPGRENAARLVVRLTRQATVTITDAQANSVTALNLNTNGWPTPNPLTVTVTLTCPAGAWNCDYYPFSLNIRGGRFYLYETTLRPDATNCYGDYPAAQTSYSTFSLRCNNYSLLAGNTVSHTWQLWAQPSDTTTLRVEATYGTESALAQLNIPRASIYPVVVIPGFLGSWKNFSGNWVIEPLLGTYNNLLEELRQAGYEDGVSLFTFPYDWRQPITENGLALGSGINDLLRQAAARPYVRTDKVDLISHSMGGLVSRAYIQGSAYDYNVRRLITLGTPHLGAPVSYLSAEGLEFEPAILKSIASHLAQKSGYCTGVVTGGGSRRCLVTNADLHRYIRERLPSVRNLFPDRRYLANDVGGYLVDSGQPSRIYPFGIQVNGFLESLNAEIGSLVSRLGAGNIIPVVAVGEEANTDLYYLVVQRSSGDVPLWANGKVQLKEPGFGDETVPRLSADLGLVDPRIQSLVFNQTDNSQAVVHRSLPTQFQLTSLEKLTGIRPPFDAGFSDPFFQNPILFFNLSPVEIQVVDPLGRKVGVDFVTWGELAEIPGAAFWRSDVSGEPDFVFINNPVEGEYIIRLAGIAAGEYTVGLDALGENGSVTVAAFSGGTAPGLRHEHRLSYNRTMLPPTPLTLTWLPPLTGDTPLPVQANRTLPIKFTVRDAQNNFVVDPNVVVWVIDPLAPGQAVAAFTTGGANNQSANVRINEQEQLYIVNLRLRDYPFQIGRTYLAGVTVFGQSLDTTAFVVMR